MSGKTGKPQLNGESGLSGVSDKTSLSTVSLPSFFSSTSIWRIFLSNVCKCCFNHPHPRLLHNQLLFGTLTTVSLNCPGGTGVLCWRRKTFTDRAFQMVSAVNIAIEGESQPLCTYITKKCATHVNSEEEMISKKLAHGLVSHRMRQIL